MKRWTAARRFHFHPATGGGHRLGRHQFHKFRNRQGFPDWRDLSSGSNRSAPSSGSSSRPLPLRNWRSWYERSPYRKNAADHVADADLGGGRGGGFFAKASTRWPEPCNARLNADPFSGSVFVFRSWRATSIKTLVYDGPDRVAACQT
jgi:hypothetical protein